MDKYSIFPGIKNKKRVYIHCGYELCIKNRHIKNHRPASEKGLRQKKQARAMPQACDSQVLMVMYSMESGMGSGTP